MNLLCYVVEFYFLICVVRVVMSWLGSGGSGTILDSIAAITYALTEPVFASVRRFMPQMGDLPIDLSPIVVFLALGVIRQFFCHLF